MSNAGWTGGEDLDFDGVSTEPPAPLENAVYRSDVVKAEPAQVGKDKKAGVKLELLVTQLFSGEAVEPARRMFDTLTLDKAALFRTKQIAASAGIETPKSTRFEDVEAFCDALVSSSGVIIRTRRELQKEGANAGKTFARVDRYLTEDQANEKGDEAGAAETPRKRRGASASA